MLEIKNLNKVYHTKGESVIAIKQINLLFGDKGFIILLGKSGSGKSTLLNLIGGLDRFDSGEIIISNHSTNHFKNHEWDLYRSTYVGFVFQEYYMIEDLTISKNIALALELQGYSKESIKEKVHDILKQVDLEGYHRRKPNEISGGQKQRVVIARALIKNPEIVLADEPTGNLDSETGRLVLNTLKKLSKTKLVIMATHDRDFALEYGDRIIELADGSILSDNINVKQRVHEYKKSEIEHIVKVPHGKVMSDDIVNDINNYLKNKEEDTFLVISENKFNQQEENKLIDLQTIQNFLNEDNLKPFMLKKTAISYKSAFRLAFHNLFIKKTRLVFMSFLFILAFILVGFAFTLSFYEPIKAATLTFEKTNTQEIPFYKQENSYDQSFISDREFNDLKERFPFIQFSKSYYIKNTLDFESFSFDEIIIINTENQNQFNLQLGHYPNEHDEVMISDRLSQELLQIGYYQNVTTVDQIIGQSLFYNNEELLIIGIIEDGIEEDNFRLVESLYMTQETFDQSINTVTTLNVYSNNSNYEYQISNLDHDYVDFLIDGSSLPSSKNEVVITFSKWNSLSESKDYLGQKFTFKIKNKDNEFETVEYIIVGVIDDVNNDIEVPFSLMFSVNEYNNLIKYNNEVLVSGIAYLNKSKMTDFLGYLYKENYYHNTPYSRTLYLFQEFSTKGNTIFFIIGGVFASFAGLLLFTYISISIVNKQKEIGTLRALGASGKDVAKIFVSEAIMIGLFTGLVANIITSIIILLINQYFTNLFQMTFVLLYINIYTILIVFSLSLLIVFISCYLPIKKLTLMKPIQVIKNI